jgi:hypothetical protein
MNTMSLAVLWDSLETTNMKRPDVPPPDQSRALHQYHCAPQL